ncbi:MAG: nitroreductase family protein [Planctomycetota bacterium]|nr:nitroreductase family protein [Planctomycetota bacterium]
MDVMEAIRKRRSVRKYSPEPIPDDVLAAMKEAIRLAPSACNNQPWRFIFVTDERLRKELAAASFDQHFVAGAPVIVVGCGIPAEAYKHMGGYGNSADVDVTIALDHLTLAAAAAGLGTCWIGAFDERRVRELLDIPPSVRVVALTPLGYPADSPPAGKAGAKKRKPPEEIFFQNRYGRT